MRRIKIFDRFQFQTMTIYLGFNGFQFPCRPYGRINTCPSPAFFFSNRLIGIFFGVFCVSKIINQVYDQVCGATLSGEFVMRFVEHVPV